MHRATPFASPKKEFISMLSFAESTKTVDDDGDRMSSMTYRKTPHPLLPKKRPTEHSSKIDDGIVATHLFFGAMSEQSHNISNEPTMNNNSTSVGSNKENGSSEGPERNKRLRKPCGVNSVPGLETRGGSHLVTKDSDHAQIVTNDTIVAEIEESVDPHKHHDEGSNSILIEEKHHDSAASSQQEWDNACEYIMTNEPEDSSYRQNLQIFLRGMERRAVARECLVKAFSQTSTALEKHMHSIIAIVAPMHDTIFQQMQQMEQDLRNAFGDNHAVRRAIRNTLDCYNDDCQRRYDNFNARLLFCDDVKASGNLTEHDQDELETGDTDVSDVGDKGISEPDWAVLVESNPSSRDNVELFLNCRDRWQTAQQHFSDALDEIHVQLCDSNARMLHIIEQAFMHIEESDDELHSDIQWHMTANCENRTQLENDLAEAARQQQSLFSRLLSRVSEGSGGADSATPRLTNTSTNSGFLTKVSPRTT